jgi:hypothetical protein
MDFLDTRTLSLTGNSSFLSAKYYPPIDLSDGAEYSLGLVYLTTYNSIANIEEGINNKFYYGIDDKVIEIPTGSYEISDLNREISRQLQKRHQDEIKVSIIANNNTLQSVVATNVRINFEPRDCIAELLGFRPQVLEPERGTIDSYNSDEPVRIVQVTSIRVLCNVITGSYDNEKPTQILYEFSPIVPPGYKLVEVPLNVIYLPVAVSRITELSLKITDQDGQPINLRGESIAVRLYLKRS